MNNCKLVVTIFHLIIFVNEIDVFEAIPSQLNEDKNRPRPLNSRNVSSTSSEVAGSSSIAIPVHTSATNKKNNKAQSTAKQLMSYAQAVKVGGPPKSATTSTTQTSEATNASKASKRNMRRSETRKKQKAIAEETSLHLAPVFVREVEDKFVKETFSSESKSDEAVWSQARARKGKKKEEQSQTEKGSIQMSSSTSLVKTASDQLVPSSPSMGETVEREKSNAGHSTAQKDDAQTDNSQRNNTKNYEITTEAPARQLSKKERKKLKQKQMEEKPVVIPVARSIELTASANINSAIVEGQSSFSPTLDLHSPLSDQREFLASLAKADEKGSKFIESFKAPQKSGIPEVGIDAVSPRRSLTTNESGKPALLFHEENVSLSETNSKEENSNAVINSTKKDLTPNSQGEENSNSIEDAALDVARQSVEQTHSFQKENYFQYPHLVDEEAPKTILLILSKIVGIDVFAELENSVINPNDFGATEIVRLLNSGVLVKCDSKAGAIGLQRVILKEFDKQLDVELTRFCSHVACVYDVPRETTDAELHFDVFRAYDEIPYAVQFVSYAADAKRYRKIGLLDISDSLLRKIKASPNIKVRWNERRIYVILSSNHQKERSHSDTTSSSSPSLGESLIFDVSIDNLPENISEIKISQNMLEKFGSTPMKVQFVPNTRRKDKLAKIFVNETLMRRIIASPKIEIGGDEKRIHTSLRVDRCTNCQLLGHVAKYCNAKTRHPPTLYEMCLDCSSYNQRYKYSKSEQREAKHITDDDECPTKIAYLLNNLTLKKSGSPTSIEESKNGDLSSEFLETPLASPQSFSQHNQTTSSPPTLVSEQPKDLPSPSVSSDLVVDDKLLEAIEKSVEQTLASKVLPLLNKSVVEAVDESVHQTLARILPTVEHFRQDKGKRKEKVLEGEHDAPVIVNSEQPENNYGMTVVLIQAKEPGIDIIKELGSMDIDSTNFQIDRAIFYPSGDVLFICDSVEGANYLRHVIANSSKLQTATFWGFPIRVRIDFVPRECTVPQLSRKIFQKYKEHPRRILFRPYKTFWRENVKIALLFINESLLRKIENSPNIQIEGNQLKIEITFRPSRCEQCQLLGHQADSCPSKPRPRPQHFEKCLDCSDYNRRLMVTGLRFKPRDENHTTGHGSCPTKVALTRNHRSDDPEI